MCTHLKDILRPAVEFYYSLDNHRIYHFFFHKLLDQYDYHYHYIAFHIPKRLQYYQQFDLFFVRQNRNFNIKLIINKTIRICPIVWYGSLSLLLIDKIIFSKRLQQAVLCFTLGFFRKLCEFFCFLLKQEYFSYYFWPSPKDTIGYVWIQDF